MNDIVTRQYRILCDHMDVYRFMAEIYEKDWRNGVPAPFLEYALSSSWMDKSFTHRNRIWMDGQKIVAFVFTESPVTDIYFSLRPGYEKLAEEMVHYACDSMPDGGRQRLIIFGGQSAIAAAAEKSGYRQIERQVDMHLDFDREIDYRLPEGFRFVPPEKLSVEKVIECCWKGFDHEKEKGPWDGDAEGGYHLICAPHATQQYAVAVETLNGEYVCWAGIWWTPENRLAYMEPLCTIPEYRGRGLAAAALSELYRRMKPLGAERMTGGSNKFYEKIGFTPAVEWTFWVKTQTTV